jgi:hypothetical protein
MAGAIATACNTITELDDLAGNECQTEADCPEAGECAQVSCTRGQCAYRIAFGKACAGGACAEDGVCVECVSDEGCGDETRPVCDQESHICIQCISNNGCSAGTSCREGRCIECWVGDTDDGLPCLDPDFMCSNIDGRCVECDLDSNCSNEKLPDVQCWQFLCVERKCVPTPTPGMTCMGGTCKENGLCSPVP